MKHTILVTGASGYVGAMLVRRFAARPDVERVIGIDREPCPELLRDLKNYTHLTTNTADDWEEKVREHHPDIVVHAAWQIRELYGAQDMEWQWNVGGSDKVFDYCFDPGNGVRRLVHFSTVASYGAFPANTTGHRFTEDEPFRATDYRYAEEKRVAEEHLQEKYGKSDKHCAVAIVRPAAITGPRGRFMRIRFGLQSTLSGQMKGGIYSVISALVAFVPVTPKWLRQFVHEDDVVAIVEKLAFADLSFAYEAFNLCPPGPAVFGADMARAVGKRVLPVRPWMVRLAFAFFWHASRGKIPTGKGAWKSYAYPIAVDGSKVTRMLGYEYQHQSLDAFRYTEGEYESFVPEAARSHPSTALGAGNA
ncbi:MAG: NAD-dependent epimerase/dehydratase family protein [Patescibacteria group bacterium]|nr:NAD-dependent epimerase/dehydratase family protein [Patescibacteria group bacterium]MDE1944150.1 NAD-dependent epimerase/dehydratase family protein [Patescibacteria group bacterium]MDE1945239.1 NAD-dependent epimerase/dehydratase family protein [Patescibacteria group bacterium]MDE2057950.1 NAD-dependent epimerase/dehydratase family protein [Patescibacteria group bacterium]